MNIILLEHIEKVGAKHEVVKVKDGYGRNYLIPKGLAIVANKPNLARLDGLKKQAAKKRRRHHRRQQGTGSQTAGRNPENRCQSRRVRPSVRFCIQPAHRQGACCSRC